MVYVDATIPLPPAEPSPHPSPALFSVPPRWPASLNSRPVLALGTFCLHRLIYSFRTLTVCVREEKTLSVARKAICFSGVTMCACGRNNLCL